MRTMIVIFLSLCGMPGRVAAEYNSCSPSAPPNIVFLLADDLGWTGLRCFGSDFYETPVLDSFAKRATKFTNAYSACTVCSPTRASIMTGKYPARLRLTDFIAGQNRPYAKMRIPDWNKGLAASEVTIAEQLKDAGYRTAHIGKWHLDDPSDRPSTSATKQGFDISHDKPPGTKGYFLKEPHLSEDGSNFATDWLTDRACEFLRDCEDTPFFLYFAYHVPHTPIQGRKDLVEYFESKINKNAVHRNPNYAAMVASLDQSVGRMLAQLEELGLDDNTIVIFTSDNGGLTQRYGKHDNFTDNLPLRRGKGSAYEGGVRVPTLVHLPGQSSAAVCDEPIMTIDWYPTIAHYAGIDLPSGDVDGRDLTVLFEDPSELLHRDLFWHYPHYHAGGDGPYSAIRSGDYRLIEFLEDQSLALYDLRSDIGEQTNLVSSNPAIAKSLKTKLDQWRDSLKAQMPTPNPNYDPARAKEVKRNRR